jgi:hypothetical protein
MRRFISLLICAALACTQAQAAGMYSSPPQNGVRVLGKLLGANFNTTADQAIAMSSAKYAVTSVLVTNCTASLTLAAGGFYSTTSKGGTAIVAAAQLYSALTSATVLLPATVAAAGLTNAFTGANVYLSLTTAQGGAATCDVYIVGVDLS